MNKKTNIHLILDPGDTALVEAIHTIENTVIAQNDFSFDTACEWTRHNRGVHIDVFLASEFAPVSTTDSEGKIIHRDVALLRRIKELRLMRPQTKFVLICDDDRDRPENRNFLYNLVAIGVYDFVIGTVLTLDKLKHMINGPPKDITHVQQYLPDNIDGGVSNIILPAQPLIIAEEKREKKRSGSVGIFGLLGRSDRPQGKESAKPKITYTSKKVNTSSVSAENNLLAKVGDKDIRQEKVQIVKPQKSRTSVYAVVGAARRVGATTFALALAEYLSKKYLVEVLDAGGGSSGWPITNRDFSIRPIPPVSITPGVITIIDAGTEIAEEIQPFLESVFVVTDLSRGSLNLQKVVQANRNVNLVGNRGAPLSGLRELARTWDINLCLALDEDVNIRHLQSSFLPKSWRKKLKSICI